MNAIAQVSAAPLTGPKLDNRRVLAGFVDLLIVAAGALVVLYAGDSVTSNRQGALSAVILGWALYYYFALESGAGQTVGKKLMKLRVVCADGRPAGMREIAVRTVLRVVDGIGMYIVGLIVMLVTGQRRQRVGDLAAGTIVVDASGPATAVAEPVAPDAVADEAEVEDREEDDDAGDEPVAAAEPTQTITLPSRPTPPETLSDLAEPAAEEVAEETEPTVDLEPIAEEPVAESEPVVEMEPVAQSEPVPAVQSEPVPVAEEALPPVASPSLQELAADVAAAQDAGDREDALAEDASAEDASAEDASESDEPVNVKSVETVSAMDLIMGAAEEDSAQQDDDAPPASA